MLDKVLNTLKRNHLWSRIVEMHPLSYDIRHMFPLSQWGENL